MKRKLRFLLPKREGGAKRCPETLLPPNKAATESSGIAALDGMVEHLVEALKQKLEVPLATAVETVVGRATEQLKTNVGRVFDQREERKRGKRKAKKREDLGLLFPFLSRAKFIFLVHFHLTEQKHFLISRAVARSTGRGLLRRPGVSQIPFPALM